MNIAVLIPCYNEDKTIGKVVADFKSHLPQARIYVFDNNSDDATAAVAAAAGADVMVELRQGKGNVVRSMFRSVEADVYVMVDGDDTYPVAAVGDLIRPVLEGQADMVIGDRLSNRTYYRENKRLLHGFGNRLVRGLINRLFRARLTDIMSGYRSFSRDFVKNVPLLSQGFEIETELTLWALDRRFLIKEVPIVYRDRPSGSQSKLRTLNDGLRVLRTIIRIFKDFKPLVFFGNAAVSFLLLGLLAGTVPVIQFIKTRFIDSVPLAVLATGLIILSVISLAIGVILDTLVKMDRYHYELQMNARACPRKPGPASPHE